MNKQVVKRLYTISWIMMEWADTTSPCFPDSPQRHRENIVVSRAHSEWEIFQIRGAQSNDLRPFRVCVRENRPFSPQESNLLRWQEFLVLLHVHTSAFHSLLCHWVYLRFQRSKPGKELLGEILIFWGKFLGFFGGVFFGIFWGGGGVYSIPDCKEGL